MEKANTVRVLSIDAWRECGGWTWNNWFHRGDVPREYINMTPRRLLAALRADGILCGGQGTLAVDDDQYNIVIVDRHTRQPIIALEYGNG